MSTSGGAVWTVGGYAAMQAFRFAFNVALAGLVAPRLLGVMALVNLFVLGLQMFSDLGVRQCVVRHPRGDDPVFLNTAWTVQVLRGVALWAGTAALGWPLAALYGEPALVWLVPLAGSAAFVQGFASTSLLTYCREVRRGPLVRRELAAYVLTFGGVLLALWLIDRRGSAPDTLKLAVIALGGVAVAVADVALSFTLPAVVAPRFAWDPEARRELLGFGGWVFVSTGCTFLAAQADRLVVGKLSLEVLGVYHIAAVVAALPAGLMAALGTHYLFPRVSAALRAGEPPAAAFGRTHRVAAVLTGLLVTGLACVGPGFVRLFYDDRYEAAAGFVHPLAVAAWFTMLATPAELTLLALGKARALAVGQAVRLACLPGLLFAGYTAAGLPGLILGVAAGEAVRYAILARALARTGLGVVAADAALTAAAALVVGGYLLIDGAAAATVGLAARSVVGGLVLVAVWGGVYLACVGWPGLTRRLVTWGPPAGRGVRP